MKREKHSVDWLDHMADSLRKVIVSLERDERKQCADWLRSRAIRLHDEATRIPLGVPQAIKWRVAEWKAIALSLETAANDLEAGREP